MPFLRNVTRGRGIPDERLVEVSHHYQALGGSLPDQRAEPAAAGRSAGRTARGIDVPVLWGNRNWAPYLADVVRDAHAGGLVRLLGVATSAYSSYSSCRQYREDFGMALAVHRSRRPGADRQGAAVLRPARVPGAVRRGHRRGRPAPPARRASPVHELEIVFTTHSIPNDDGRHLRIGRPGRSRGGRCLRGPASRRRRGGDRRRSRSEVGELPPWQLAYQSRSGPPSVPWLEPDINDVIASCWRRPVPAG